MRFPHQRHDLKDTTKLATAAITTGRLGPTPVSNTSTPHSSFPLPPTVNSTKLPSSTAPLTPGTVTLGGNQPPPPPLPKKTKSPLSNPPMSLDSPLPPPPLNGGGDGGNINKPPTKTKGNYVLMAYFTNWSIYSRNYMPMSIPFDKLTHLLYAFANCDVDGSVVLTDSWADTDKHFADDPWTGSPTALYGCLGKIARAKRNNRNLKLMLSVGGWTLSTNFAAVAADPSKRAVFVKTAVGMLEDLGLDGIDIDWEFPASVAEGENFLSLLQELRAGLDRHAEEKQESEPYQISIACSCGQEHYGMLPLKKMALVLDFFNLMAYDFAGSFTTATGHQARLFGEQPSGSAAVTDFILSGVPANKIVLGIPIYGRSFANTEGGPDKPYHDVGPGSFEKGVYDYKALPLQGAQVQEDLDVVAASCYQPQQREWVTYDTSTTVKTKCNWVLTQKLGGVMFWELSGDIMDNPAMNLIQTAWNVVGGDFAAQQKNHLYYPKSKYDDLRNAATSN